MVFGPYESKLLRLAIGQYWKGVERHRKVVRQTRSTVATGVVLGGAWALVSVKTAVRWSQRWERQLKRIVAAGRGDALRSFEADSTEMNDTYLDDSAAIARVISVLNVVLSKRLAAASTDVTSIGKIKALFSRRFVWLRRKAQLTGFASDLKTHSIVLVWNNVSVRDDLTDAQQQQIKREIAKRLEGVDVCVVEGGERYSELSASNGLSKCVRPTNVVVRSPTASQELAYSARAFWVEVLRVVAHLKRRQQRLSLGVKRLQSQSAARKGLLGCRVKVTQTMAGSPLLKVPVLGFSGLRLLAFGDDCSIEADVISSCYVEHPLERLLNWIDKCLLWLERQWQHLINCF